MVNTKPFYLQSWGLTEAVACLGSGYSNPWMTLIKSSQYSQKREEKKEGGGEEREKAEGKKRRERGGGEEEGRRAGKREWEGAENLMSSAV